MSNYYDLETDLGVEDVATDEEYEDFGAYDDAYEQAESFGNYNPEEADAKWGAMSFDELVVEMESIIAKSKRYFFSKKKRVINGEDLTHLAQHIQNKLPSEIIEAKDIIDRQNKILSDANNEKDGIIKAARKEEELTVGRAKEYYSSTVQKAQNDAAGIITEAEERAAQMVAETTIYQRAQEESAQLIESSKREANAIYSKAEEESDKLINNARQVSVNMIEAARQYIITGLTEYREASVSHIQRVDNLNGDLQERYTNLMRDLGL